MLSTAWFNRYHFDNQWRLSDVSTESICSGVPADFNLRLYTARPDIQWPVFRSVVNASFNYSQLVDSTQFLLSQSEITDERLYVITLLILLNFLTFILGVDQVAGLIEMSVRV